MPEAGPRAKAAPRLEHELKVISQAGFVACHQFFLLEVQQVLAQAAPGIQEVHGIADGPGRAASLAVAGQDPELHHHRPGADPVLRAAFHLRQGRAIPQPAPVMDLRQAPQAIRRKLGQPGD